MMVLIVSSCPPSLRGDLSKWLMEISTGVYVGRLSSRVRDELWDRAVRSSKNGKVLMVYDAMNEQHMEFRLHNCGNTVVDYDGLKMILHPSEGSA